MRQVGRRQEDASNQYLATGAADWNIRYGALQLIAEQGIWQNHSFYYWSKVKLSAQDILIK